MTKLIKLLKIVESLDCVLEMLNLRIHVKTAKIRFQASKVEIKS